MQAAVPSVFGALHPAQTSVRAWTPQLSASVQGGAQLPLLSVTVPRGQPRSAPWQELLLFSESIFTPTMTIRRRAHTPRPAATSTAPLCAERPAAPRRGAVAQRTEKPPKGWR
jgi:hypothetical protein